MAHRTAASHSTPLDLYVARLIAAAPPITPAQRDTITRTLRATNGGRR